MARRVKLVKGDPQFVGPTQPKDWRLVEVGEPRRRKRVAKKKIFHLAGRRREIERAFKRAGMEDVWERFSHWPSLPFEKPQGQTERPGWLAVQMKHARRVIAEHGLSQIEAARAIARAFANKGIILKRKNGEVIDIEKTIYNCLRNGRYK